jgi:hypothetical protein
MGHLLVRHNYFWKMNCFEHCNDIDWSTCIQNLSGIGTFVAAVIGVWTLRVLIKQRRDTFRPRVIFGNGFYAQCKAPEKSILKTLWTNHEPKGESHYVTLELLNLGYGVAENVVLIKKWDIDKAIEFIKDKDKDNELLITKTKDELIIKTTFDDTFIINQFSDNKSKLGSIPTMEHSGNKPNKYWLSDNYLSLLSCLGYIMERHDRFLSLENYPKMKLEIKYCDIENRNYEAEYELNVQPIASDKFSFRIVKK